MESEYQKNTRNGLPQRRNTPSTQLQPVDRISNLPENIIDDILMCVPTHDAAEVLLHHRGPITKFSLIIPKLESCSHIDHMINLLSNSGVEEFIFETEHGYRIPSSLFMYLLLKHLTLSAGLINPPPTFKGFNGLVRVELCYVIIHAEVLQSLLRVTAYEHYEDDEFNYRNCTFVGFFDSLPALHKLCMDCHFMLVKSKRCFQLLLIHLKILKLLHIYLDSEEEFSCVLRLIRRSPNLEKMKISVIMDWEGSDASHVSDFLNVQYYSDVLLNQLQEVRLESISGTVSEMTLIMLLLEKSPKLKRMVIDPVQE
ncbi:F-box/FBD/LRR-repeat protein At1g13570-like [Olea europaea var. sylvestris]|uniref:F-box/FBD/LRR-repeat protein At1g13570-like n=1 Tax=Olea europaea var. sylvestris TaxID=158386 RepID=UPI000C1CE47E|nr:F-box/FBD/LRR-repeat protein At1g13570-like [Olea europaea var. sylvestris]